MRYQNIEQFITQFPIYQYEMIDTSEIEFNDKIRAHCKKECSRYGTSWSCPPAVGNLEKCKGKCLKFPKALIFSSVAEVPGKTSGEQLLKMRSGHEQIVRQVIKFLSANSVPCYALSTDVCLVCEKCTYPKKSCIRPDAMIPCIESHGINLVDLAEKCQMDYMMGEDMIIWFGIVFIEED